MILKMCEVCGDDEVLHPFRVCNSCHLEWLELKRISKVDWNDNRNYDYSEHDIAAFLIREELASRPEEYCEFGGSE